MATTTVTLDENDLRDAVHLWLQARGMRPKGKPSVSHQPGDAREPASTTISVSVEFISPSPEMPPPFFPDR